MTEATIRDILRERLTRLEERILRVCTAVARPRSSINLVAVTKTVHADVARQCVLLGVQDCGENRPQELQRKAQALADLPIRWHMIGHLQRNKVEFVLPYASLIHSVDSTRLLAEIAKQAAARQQPAAVLLQINGSREANKSGFDYPALATVLAEPLPSSIHLHGFMTMAAVTDQPEDARPTFRELAQFAAGTPYHALSMGMSGDFEAAIAEGATHIRIGSTLFEGLPGPG